MRKVTQLTAKALKNLEPRSLGNTKVFPVENSPWGRRYKTTLHGNIIADYDKNDGTLWISDCGWRTNTTKERLNGILDTFGINAYINQSKGVWVYNTHGGDNDPITSSVWHGTMTIYL